MKNWEKDDLARIVKNIPKKEYGKSIIELWHKYAPFYTYQTFKNYFKVWKK